MCGRGVDKGYHSAMYGRQQTPQHHTRQKWQTRENKLDPKAVPLFIYGDPSWNYLLLRWRRRRSSPATQNIE